MLCCYLNINLKFYYWYLQVKFLSQNITERQLYLLPIQNEHITVCVLCVCIRIYSISDHFIFVLVCSFYEYSKTTLCNIWYILMQVIKHNKEDTYEPTNLVMKWRIINSVASVGMFLFDPILLPFQHRSCLPQIFLHHFFPFKK